MDHDPMAKDTIVKLGTVVKQLTQGDRIPLVPAQTGQPVPRQATRRLVDRLESLLFPHEHPPSLEGANPALPFSRLELLGNVVWDLAHHIHQLTGHQCPAPSDCTSLHEALATAVEFSSRLPAIQELLIADAQAAFDGDPAARHLAEIIATYPGFHATLVFRLAHELFVLGVPLLPRLMTEMAHSETGIDIHPGATIGKSFFIDHGTGVVIGETTVIGDRVTIYQGVTLGALNFPHDQTGQIIRGQKRHPTIGDDVVIYSGATILGGNTVIGEGSIIGGNVWITESVPPFSKVTAEPTIQLRARVR